MKSKAELFSLRFAAKMFVRNLGSARVRSYSASGLRVEKREHLQKFMTRLSEILGYEVLGTLGHGARSTIFAVKDPSNHIFALKRVIKSTQADQRYIDQAILEHEIAQKFDHPSLRKSFRLFRHRQLLRVTEIDVLMEMVDGVTLEQYKPKDLIELVRLCQQVAGGLVEMHKVGIVHSDIKPNNILVTGSDSVKIIDFGQSCPTNTIKARIQGTPDYIAPEQVNRRRITPRTDVFNLGATMYWLLTGKHVPTLIPKGQPGAVLKSDRGESGLLSPREIDQKVTPALSMLVMNCLEQDPRQRPDMNAVFERLDLAHAQLLREQEAAANGRPRRRSAV